MAELNGLGFYNAGRAAGASQPHKHLQLVGLPLAPGVAGLPVDALLASAGFEGCVGRVPSLPFRLATSRRRTVDFPETDPFVRRARPGTGQSWLPWAGEPFAGASLCR